jgi:hypothetical protein
MNVASESSTGGRELAPAEQLHSTTAPLGPKIVAEITQMKRLGRGAALLPLFILPAQTLSAHAETLVKHSREGSYPVAWSSYHGSRSTHDYVLNDLKERGLIKRCFPTCKGGR